MRRNTPGGPNSVTPRRGTDADHPAPQGDRHTSAAPAVRAAFLIAVAAALLEVSTRSAMVGGVVVVLFVVALGELDR